MQIQEESCSFVNSLLSVAKDIGRLTRSRECIQQYKNETEALNKNEENSQKLEQEQEDPVQNDRIDLQMDVIDDKDYDVEEIKFWNFISKNRGVKPNVIRTIVYKVPESSYISRKCPVYVQVSEEPSSCLKEALTSVNETRQTLKSLKYTETCTQTEHLSVVEKKQEIKSSNVSAAKAKAESNPSSSEILSQLPADTLSKFAPIMGTNKYNIEDLILIDEDDDILNYVEDEDDEEVTQAIVKTDTTKSRRLVAGDENNQEKTERTSDLLDKRVDEGEVDYISPNQAKKQVKKPGPGRGRPKRKTAVEKPNESASAVSNTRKRRSSVSTWTNNLASSETVMSEVSLVDVNNSTLARRSSTIRASRLSSTDLSLHDEQPTATSRKLSVSGSSSTTSSIATTTDGKTLRVTRSKAKLV